MVDEMIQISYAAEPRAERTRGDEAHPEFMNEKTYARLQGVSVPDTPVGPVEGGDYGGPEAGQSHVAVVERGCDAGAEAEWVYAAGAVGGGV